MRYSPSASFSSLVTKKRARYWVFEIGYYFGRQPPEPIRSPLDDNQMMSVSNKLPLVSIVVPVFNGERYLRESLDSILAQTYSRTEIIVMDDASTDGTAEIIASYGGRISHYRQPQNRGIYGNMNDGIAGSQGELIAI